MDLECSAVTTHQLSNDLALYLGGPEGVILMHSYIQIGLWELCRLPN